MPMMTAYLLPLARLLMASLFLWDGVLQLRHPDATAQYFASVNVPFANIAVWPSIAIHLLGGLALLLGFKTRWAALADQAIFNIWHPDQATWGGHAQHWSGWAICDPGNNYHYNFLRVTMLWAWAKQDATLLTFLQTQKFPPLIDYFVGLPGGGTREGTGYGTSLNSLFETYITWKASTGENLAGLTPHTRDTLDYWVHATVPTLQYFAPIGDLSRDSVPNIYDYQRNLVHEAVVLVPTTDQAKHGVWWTRFRW